MGRPFSLDDQFDQVFARGQTPMLPVQTHLAEPVKLPDAMAVYRDRSGDASDSTFAIVGAATPEQTKPLVERYIASLPSTLREARETPVVPDVAPFSRHMRFKFANELVPRSDRASGATPAETATRLRVQQRRRETRLQDNSYWMETMVRFNRLGLPLDRVGSPFPEKGMTSEEVKEAAQRYLPSTVYLHFAAVARDSSITEGRSWARLTAPAPPR